MTKRRRLSRAGWLDLGLEAVAEDGPLGLGIDALTARAGKTTGSFYAHFASMAEFLEALSAHWLGMFTTEPLRKITTWARPADRLDHLNRLVFHFDPRIERGMRRLAAFDPLAAEACAHADRERIAFLTGEYASSGRFTQAQAADLALIEYAAFVGLLQTEPENSPDEFMRLYNAFLAFTGRH